MMRTIFAYLCIAALTLPVTSVLADDEREPSKSKTSKDYSDKDNKKDKKKDKKKSKSDDYHDDYEQAGSKGNKGNKHGWVNGMPPRQAKKSGGDKVKHKDHDHEDHNDNHDYDHHREEYRDGGTERNIHYDRNQRPATSEEILTDMAKDEAARRAGAAPGSAEEALINIGADVILERTNR